MANFGHFWDFFPSSFSREIYVQWGSNQGKNAFQGRKNLFWAFLKKSQKWFRNKEAFQDLKKLFEGNLIIREAIIGIWLFARANILHVFSREIYVQWSSNQDKNSFQGLKKLFEANLLFALRTLESDYSPGRKYLMFFLEKYTSNEDQTKIKMLFKA